MQERPNTSAPASISQRIHALDVLRGLAVFGILVVNLEQMFLPMFYANSPIAVVPGEWGAGLAWFITDAFFESKFLTLFSLLFGVGFALQWHRAADGGRGFVPRFLRRLLLLAAFGFVHAIFFYAADVLFLYALIALALIPFRRASARRLLRAGASLVVVTIGWHAVISGPDPPDTADRQRAAVAAVAEARARGEITLPAQEIRRPAAVELAAHPDWQPIGPERVRIPESTYPLPLPSSLATAFLRNLDEPTGALVAYTVYSHGPVATACFGRSLFFAGLILLYTPFYLGWRVLGLFLIGASLVAAGRIADPTSGFWRRCRGLGLGLGLPLTLVASAIRLVTFETQSGWLYLGDLLHDVSSLLLAAGIGGAVMVWASSGLHSAPLRAFSAVGRTALTNYIGQSVVMSVVATSYGFGLYHDLSRLQLLAVAVACFACQIVLSAWWLHHFRVGPLEWVWRCFTYGRLLPLRRERRDTECC